MLSHRIESVMICRSRQRQLWRVARVAVLALMAGTGCKATQNPQKDHNSTVAPVAPMPRAPTVKAAPPASTGSRVGEDRKALPTNDKTRRCDEICRIAAPLGCPHQDECVNGCETMASASVCRAEMSRMYDCLLRQPVEHWECDENGVGAIRDPFCGKEQAAVVKCAESNADRI